jgi:hypothetical protein
MQIYSHVQEVPLALAVFLATDNYDHNPDPFTISATSLMKPLRQIILASRVPKAQAMTPLPDMVKNRLGAAIHDGIESAWLNNHKQAMLAMGYPEHVIERVVVNPDAALLAQRPNAIPVYLEQRLSKKVGKWTVTGKFDFVGEGRVQDFKSTAVWTYLNQVNNNKYALQGSLYRWLDPQLITENELDIHFIFMDWSQAKTLHDPSYPKRQFLTQRFELKNPFETDQYVRKKLAQIEKYWDAPEDQIPDCDDEELWRSAPVWKYYSNPEKTQRSSRNFDAKVDAYTYWAEKGGKGIVKEIEGEVTACKYCPSYVVCGQKDRLIASGQLKVGL